MLRRARLVNSSETERLFVYIFHLKNIKELKSWDLVHVDLIGPYIKSIRQQNLGGAIIQNDDSLTCTTMIDPATGWFDVVKILTFDLDELTAGNDEYIDKSSVSVIQLFNSHVYSDTRVHSK